MILARFVRQDMLSKDNQHGQNTTNPKAIRSYLRGRRNRSGILGADLFADPAWDMLLELYASEAEGRRVSASGLCACSGVAQTTALRWLRQLEDAGLVKRRADQADARRFWIGLTDEGRIGMGKCLTHAMAERGNGPEVESDALRRLGTELVRDQLAHDCLQAMRVGQVTKAARLADASTELDPPIGAMAFEQAYKAVLRSLTDLPPPHPA